MKRLVALVVLLLFLLSGTARAEKFSFVSVRPNLVVLASSREVGRRVAEAGEAVYPELARLFRYHPEQQITIYVYRDATAFRRLSDSATTVGEAQPGRLTVYVLGTQPNLPEVVRHELVHIFFLRSVHKSQLVPFWFSEGLAIYFSRPAPSPANYDRLAVEGGWHSLKSAFLRDRQTTQGSAEGYLVVRAIAERWGERQLLRVVWSMQLGDTLEAAVQKVLGVSLDQLDRFWQGYARRVQDRQRWEVLASFGWLALAAVSVLLPAAWMWHRRRLRQGDEDSEEDGGYWYPEGPTG